MPYPEAPPQYPALSRSASRTLLLAVAILLAASSHARAQADDALPDAPSAAQAFNPTPPIAAPHAKYIEPGQQAPRLTAAGKAVVGVKDAFSAASIFVWILVAGYEQAFNLSPNFPENKAGYFRRLGSAGARDSSEEIFGDCIFAPLFHQDPRYYKVGRRRNIGYRILYAGTRPLITRTDAGHLAPNVSELTGTAFGSWLTNVYYPTANQGFDQTAKTFGGSVGSSAIGDLVVEFADDVLTAVHLRRPQ